MAGGNWPILEHATDWLQTRKVEVVLNSCETLVNVPWMFWDLRISQVALDVYIYATELFL